MAIEEENFLTTTNEWFQNTADDLTSIMAAVMNINKSKANLIVNATVGKLGFAGATAGVFGVASLVGTAGTGTAIGTLSGAAATSATLAWVGGSVFIGGLVLSGIGIIGGLGAVWLWKGLKGKPRKYEDLYENEQKIVNACANLAKAFKEQVQANTVLFASAQPGAAQAGPDKATMNVVIQEGLLPLIKELEKYLRPENSEALGFINDMRVSSRKDNLKRRVVEAQMWMGGFANG